MSRTVRVVDLKPFRAYIVVERKKDVKLQKSRKLPSV